MIEEMKMRKIALILALVMFPAHLGYAATDETLVVYLPFDEGTGEKIEDQSSYGHDAEIIANTEWVEGRFKNAISISGQSVDCVIIPAADSLKIENEITMMAWVKKDEWLGMHAFVIDRSCNNGMETTSYGFAVDNNIDVFLGNGVTPPGLRLIVQAALELKKWHHVAVTYDGEKIRVYLDGGLIREQNDSFEFQGTNDADLRIGCAKDRANYTFHGAIDEVVVYSRVLDEVEINQVMNGSLTSMAVFPKSKLITTWARIKDQD